MRHVQPARLRKDADDQVIGFLAQAFERRADEDYLSAAWVEYAARPTFPENIAATVIAFQANRKVRASHRFAVGKIREACLGHGQKVRISHEPLEDFEAHASIRQFNTDASELLELLAEETWAEMHSIA